jgi:tRNA threonylcarbamoyladenosine biosynthesis protein TsaB
MLRRILAIETATPLGGVAVVCGEEVLFEKTFSSERSHNSQLFAPLREAVAVVGDALDVVVVGTGPASYTGVRIGIAAAQGIAMARGVPVIGMPSVLAVDGHSAFHVCGDARRGSFFVAEVRDGALVGGITTLNADALRARHGESHDGAPWFTFDAKPLMGLENARRVSPSASRLARIASLISEGEFLELAKNPLEPLYLSAPFVTMPGKS